MMQRITVLIMLMLAAGVSVLHAENEFEMGAEQQRRAGVEVTTVSEHRFGEAFRVIGEVQREPGTTEAVKSLVSGRVEQVLVSPGESVRPGQGLIVLHSHDLMSAQHELQRMADQLSLAETRLRTGEYLLEVEGIAPIEVEARRLEVRAARRVLEAARSELLDLGMSREAIDEVLNGEADPHLVVRANTPGVVLKVDVQPHLWVQAFESLVTLGDVHRLELGLQIPADQADRIAAGDRIEFRPVGGSPQRGSAEVVSRVPEVDPMTRTLRIRARLVAEIPGLYPGVFVEGTMQTGEERVGLAVPREAVIRVDNVNSVFVRRSETSFACVPVEIGRTDAGYSEVLSGLEAGDAVATGGVFLLKSTMLAAGGEE